MSKRTGKNRTESTHAAIPSKPRRNLGEKTIPLLLASVAIVAWFRAGLLLCELEFYVYRYEIAPRDTGSAPSVAVLLLLGGLLAFGLWRAVHCGVARESWKPTLWLLASAAIPLAEGLRAAGVSLPYTFFEPLGFALASGMAVWHMVRREVQRAAVPPHAADWAVWPVVAVLATAVFAAWCYHESVDAYSVYQLGFADFGDHGRRVVNTWEGRGLLTRSPQWAPFFDHFDGGLVVLAPLWGLWPDARLFFLIQAFCLALPAVCVYGIARRLGATRLGGAAWTAAYLVFPAVGQLNLNYSYGWHDVSLALPLVAAAFWAYLSDRRWLAVGLAAFATTFKEEVFVFLAGLAFGLMVLELWQRRTAGRRGVAEASRSAPPSTGLRPWQWAAVSAGFAAGFFVVSRLFGLMENPTVWKFKNLGSTPGEIALSPLLHPREFWGQVIQSDSVYYLLAMLVPAGLPSVLRGWPILIALAAPWMVLLGWQFDAARSIAFQYVTIQIPVIFLAAMVGAWRTRRDPTSFDRLLPAGAMALVTGTVASVYLGAMPFSGVTIAFTRTAEEKARLGPYTATLDRAVALVDRPEASVIASGRLAAHLLAVGRLEMVGFAMECMSGLAREAGPGRAWIEVFEWVAVDLNDRLLHHSLDELKTVVIAAETAGYRLVMAESGVLVYRHPRLGEADQQDPLAPRRVSQAEMQRAVEQFKPALQTADLRVLATRMTPVGSRLGPQRLEMELIFQATSDEPAEYRFRQVFRDRAGKIVADSGPFVPVGGNRPTSWWKKGEAWRERMALTIPPEYDPDQLSGELQAEVVRIGE